MHDMFIDVLDSNGRKTGRSVSKKEIHVKGLWFASVHTWTYTSKGELFIHRRAKQKKAYPGRWGTSFGGHVDAGETPRQAAVRELFEESGIHAEQRRLKFLRIRKLVSYAPRIHWHSKEFCSIFAYQYDGSLRNIKMQKEKVDKLELIPLKIFLQEVKRKDMQHTRYLPFDKIYYLDTTRNLLKIGKTGKKKKEATK